MPVCIRSLPRFGIKFHSRDTGGGEYGSDRQFISGYRRNPSARKYGRNKFHIYLFGDRHYIECSEERRTVGREDASGGWRVASGKDVVIIIPHGAKWLQI